MPAKTKDKKPDLTKQVIRVHEHRRKKKHEEAEGNGERWLLTYADMITLLMALFIILFAISTPNKVKYDILAKEMSGGFGGTSPVNTPAKGPQDAAKAPATPGEKSSAEKKSAEEEKKSAEEKKTAEEKKLEKEIKEKVKELKMEKQVIVSKDGRGLVISLLTDRASFGSGSAVLQPGGAALLHAIGPFLRNITNEVRVEGNTDNIPIATAEYPSNWELSAARAVVVTRELSEREGLNPTRLSAAGYGQFKPHTDNLSEDHRKLNRRVDIVILNTRPAKDAEKSQQDDGGNVTRGDRRPPQSDKRPNK